MTEPGGTGYTLDNAWGQARRRLSLLEACCDPATFRRLDALGVGPGWHCLEVGAGGGSVARRLCARVGAEGRVTAVDLDTRFLDDLREPNLEVRRMDVTTGELPREAFDLVHARALLQHLPRRHEVLAALVSAARPGGWVLVEESDRYPISALATGLHAEVLGAVLEGLAGAGMDLAFARRLPGLLQDRGLVQVGAESEASLFEGGSPAAELLRLTVAQTRALAEGAGAEPGQLDRWDALVRQPGAWFPGFALVAAWGRRPDG